MTYSPPLTLFLPKLEPTVPVQRHVCPAAFFHVAVADWPTVRQVTARLGREGEGAAVARERRTNTGSRRRLYMIPNLRCDLKLQRKTNSKSERVLEIISSTERERERETHHKQHDDRPFSFKSAERKKIIPRSIKPFAAYYVRTTLYNYALPSRMPCYILTRDSYFTRTHALIAIHPALSFASYVRTRLSSPLLSRPLQHALVSHALKCWFPRVRPREADLVPGRLRGRRVAVPGLGEALLC